MHFFLTEIVARFVAIYLACDIGRLLWDAYVGRKIAPYSPSLLDRLYPDRIAHRDVSPVSYWFIVSLHVGTFLCCIVIAIFDWFTV
jgi:hypothetical protein